MDETKRLARVSTLLDELRDYIGSVSTIIVPTRIEMTSRVDEIQRILLGDRETRSEDN